MTERVPKPVVAIARRLREYPGGLTAKDLNSTYVDIYPLIERKYATVTSIYGTPIYVLTEEGVKWLDSEPVPRKRIHRPE